MVLPSLVNTLKRRFGNFSPTFGYSKGSSQMRNVSIEESRRIRTGVHCGALLAITLMLAVTGFTAGLNDTGNADCSNDTVVDNTTGVQADVGSHPRQDCRYGRDAAVAGMPKVGGGGKGFDFSKIANDGTVLAESAVLGTGAKDWACTKDNVTGLVWEVKTTSGPRSQSNTYTWYNNNAATNGSGVGTVSGGICNVTGHCDTAQFIFDVNATGLCGATDWRVPGIEELDSITDLGRSNPSIDPTYFPNTPASYFWSASAAPWGSLYAWALHFFSGNAGSDFKSNAHQIRLVHTGQ
jgi:hypothetical protein